MLHTYIYSTFTTNRDICAYVYRSVWETRLPIACSLPPWVVVDVF